MPYDQVARRSQLDVLSEITRATLFGANPDIAPVPGSTGPHARSMGVPAGITRHKGVDAGGGMAEPGPSYWRARWETNTLAVPKRRKAVATP